MFEPSFAMLFWFLSMLLCMYILATKWVDTTRIDSNLPLAFLTLAYACMFTDSFTSKPSGLVSVAAGLSLISLSVWTFGKVKWGMHCARLSKSR